MPVEHKTRQEKLQEHIGWTDGHFEPFEDFPYHKLDGHGEPLAPADMAAETVARIIRHCWDNRGPHSDSMNTAFLRFVVISRALQPDIFNGCGYRELSDKLGCTKQNVANILRDFSKAFGVHFRQRSETACENIRQARLKQRDASGKVIARNKKPQPVKAAA